MDLDSYADVPPNCEGCGGYTNVKRVQFRIPGKAHDFDGRPKGKKHLCGACRKKPENQGRFRIIEGW